MEAGPGGGAGAECGAARVRAAGPPTEQADPKGPFPAVLEPQSSELPLPLAGRRGGAGEQQEHSGPKFPSVTAETRPAGSAMSAWSTVSPHTAERLHPLNSPIPQLVKALPQVAAPTSITRAWGLARGPDNWAQQVLGSTTGLTLPGSNANSDRGCQDMAGQTTLPRAGKGAQTHGSGPRHGPTDVQFCRKVHFQRSRYGSMQNAYSASWRG